MYHMIDDIWLRRPAYPIQHLTLLAPQVEASDWWLLIARRHQGSRALPGSANFSNTKGRGKISCSELFQ